MTVFLSNKIFKTSIFACSSLSEVFTLHPAGRMKKFKRRLSLTLRGSQTIDESLSELAEQMTVEESSSKDNGNTGRETVMPGGRW